jgi:hypothetical protein
MCADKKDRADFDRCRRSKRWTDRYSVRGVAGGGTPCSPAGLGILLGKGRGDEGGDNAPSGSTPPGSATVCTSCVTADACEERRPERLGFERANNAGCIVPYQYFTPSMRKLEY